MGQQALLDRIAADIVANNVCPDLAKTAKNLVLGDGNPNADILFLGEAPGKNEDEQGRPFVGAAGKFLDEMLAGIGLDRSEVYITNTIKYRPPNNRDPEPSEKQEFLPYLYRQLVVIQPKLIVTLGRHAMETFLPKQRISVIHGQPKRIKVATVNGELSWTILPLFHPAAALYNGGLRQTLMDDFTKIPKTIALIEEEGKTNDQQPTKAPQSPPTRK